MPLISPRKLFSCRQLVSVSSPLVNDNGKVVAGKVSGLDWLGRRVPCGCACVWVEEMGEEENE